MTKRARDGGAKEERIAKKRKRELPGLQLSNVEHEQSDHAESADRQSLPDQQSPAYPKASLLGIPGELRNNIYRYALLEDTPIKIDRNFVAPGILSTCHQTRKEAKSIYEAENIGFLLIVQDYKAVGPTETHWLFDGRCRWVIEHTGNPVWDNLKDWMRRCHSYDGYGACPPELLGEDEEPVYQMASRAYGIVRSLRDTAPWDMVEEVLEQFKAATEAHDPRFWH